VIDNLIIWGLGACFGFSLLTGLLFCLGGWLRGKQALEEPEEAPDTTLEEKFLAGQMSAEKFFKTVDRRRAAHQKGPLT
jgi:hypothetical protein